MAHTKLKDSVSGHGLEGKAMMWGAFKLFFLNYLLWEDKNPSVKNMCLKGTVPQNVFSLKSGHIGGIDL